MPVPPPHGRSHALPTGRSSSGYEASQASVSWKAAVSGSLEMLLKRLVSPGTVMVTLRDLEGSDPVWSDFISRKGHPGLPPSPSLAHCLGANHPTAVWSPGPSLPLAVLSYPFQTSYPCMLFSSLHYRAALYNWEPVDYFPLVTSATPKLFLRVGSDHLHWWPFFL